MAASKTTLVNGVSAAAILKHYEFDPARVERIKVRQYAKPEIAIQEYNPEWPAHFQVLKQRIVSALGPVQGEDDDSSTASATTRDSGSLQVLGVHHRGSTSVPGLPAKNTIDIDLVVSDNTLEELYVSPLEAAGFEFLIREPGWHEHRFFASPPDEHLAGASCNLHVWGPRCPEVERHRIFHEWLVGHEDDRLLYARTKRECAEVSTQKGELMMEYNLRKEWVIREILERAFKELGILGQDETWKKE